MDAELLLADMEFFEEDTDENIQLKNSVIELYNARLDERIRRKKFVIERGLLDLKRTQKYERKRSKEEREIINSMKIFARFNTEEEHQKIVNNLIKERLLREVIEQIKFFRSKGLTSLDQIEKYIDSQRKSGSGGQLKRAEWGAGFKDFGPTQMLLEDPEQILGTKNAQLIKYGSSLSRHNKKVNLDDEYGLLDNRERDFCKERNISSADFYKVKQTILME